MLLDECTTNKLQNDFVGPRVSTIDDAGFKGLKNGELLAAASGEFDVLVTVDQNLRFQQNIKSFDIAILVLRAVRSTYRFSGLLCRWHWKNLNRSCREIS